MKKLHILFFSLIILFISSCDKKDDSSEPMLIFKYTFDENGARLDNFGEPAAIPSGNAAQTPQFNKLGVHSIELINYVISQPTSGTVIYRGAEKMVNGERNIDFNQEKMVEEGEVLVKIPIKDIEPGTYTYLRNSLGYQNYNIDLIHNDPTYGQLNINAELASFVGYRTYIDNFKVGNEIINVNGVEPQGYWAFNIEEPVSLTQTGHSPVTTVSNPLDDVSPIPSGSCLVTGEFEEPLTITGDETEDVVVNVAISINKSFEWVDTNPDGKYEPAIENVVDMGTRGLKATIE